MAIRQGSAGCTRRRREGSSAAAAGTETIRSKGCMRKRVSRVVSGENVVHSAIRVVLQLAYQFCQATYSALSIEDRLGPVVGMSSGLRLSLHQVSSLKEGLLTKRVACPRHRGSHCSRMKVGRYCQPEQRQFPGCSSVSAPKKLHVPR